MTYTCAPSGDHGTNHVCVMLQQPPAAAVTHVNTVARARTATMATRARV